VPAPALLLLRAQAVTSEVVAVSVSFSPFALNPIAQSMDRLLDEAFPGGASRALWARGGGAEGAAVQPMPLDVYATGDAVVLLAAVPGMRPEDLEITAHQNTITLSGKVHSPVDAEEAKGATWYVHELWSGQYRRSLTLPFEIDAAKAEAGFEGGIVRVVLPKAERAKPTKIALSLGRVRASGDRRRRPGRRAGRPVVAQGLGPRPNGPTATLPPCQRRGRSLGLQAEAPPSGAWLGSLVRGRATDGSLRPPWSASGNYCLRHEGVDVPRRV
jgi:HSP20 family protein